MFQFFQTRNGATIAWLGGTVGAGIIIYALLSGHSETQVETAIAAGAEDATQSTVDTANTEPTDVADEPETAIATEVAVPAATEDTIADEKTAVTDGEVIENSDDQGAIETAEPEMGADTPETQSAEIDTKGEGGDVDNRSAATDTTDGDVAANDTSEPAEDATAQTETPATQPAPSIEEAAVADDTTQPASEPKTPAPSGEAPTFDLIRIDSRGSAVFAGRTSPNADIEILANGQLIGTASATSSGEFVAMLETPQSASPQSIELVARSVDGAVTRSAEPVIVLGRLSEPDRPQPDTQPQEASELAIPAIVRTDGDEIELIQAPRSLASDQVVLDTITYDTQSAVVLVGRGQPGREVRVYADGALQGRVNIAGDGAWRLIIADLAEGTYTLRADQIGGDGKVNSRFETPFQRQFPPAETLARLQDEKEIVVQPGNNLWTIARNRYGEGVKFTVIFDANKDQIRDPDLIYPGQVFDLPDQEDL